MMFHLVQVWGTCVAPCEEIRPWRTVLSTQPTLGAGCVTLTPVASRRRGAMSPTSDQPSDQEQ